MTHDAAMTVTLVKMLVFLLLMAGGAVGVVYLLKRLAPSAGSAATGQLINVLGSRTVAPKKSVALIQVPGAVLVVGMAGDNLTLLDKIEDLELVAELSAQPAQPSFKGLLDRIGSKPKKNK
jgi:flagellar protein FliO/FliZ